jgi:hypothetical protein
MYSTCTLYAWEVAPTPDSQTLASHSMPVHTSHDRTRLHPSILIYISTFIPSLTHSIAPGRCINVRSMPQLISRPRDGPSLRWSDPSFGSTSRGVLDRANWPIGVYTRVRLHSPCSCSLRLCPRDSWSFYYPSPPCQRRRGHTSTLQCP